MFAALRKTAMSAIIYEVLDAGTAVTAANGDLASSGAGIPSFVGVLDKRSRGSSSCTRSRSPATSSPRTTRSSAASRT
jgi:N-methylhydantoinase B/oxoprolinase/acetone carboxylase alpha subunit